MKRPVISWETLRDMINTYGPGEKISYTMLRKKGRSVPSYFFKELVRAGYLLPHDKWYTIFEIRKEIEDIPFEEVWKQNIEVYKKRY